MDFLEVMRRRRMIRHFRPDPVPDDVLQRVVRVVRRAPSAGFSQPHLIVVVTDPGVRGQIARLSEPWYLEHGFEPWLSQAPAHLLLGVREAAYHERYQEADKLKNGEEIPWPVPFWWFDAGALFMLLQLAAINEGLAAGFHSPADPGQLARLGQLAGMPGDVAPLGLLAVGYPADDPLASRESVARRRKPLDEMIWWRRLRHQPVTGPLVAPLVACPLPAGGPWPGGRRGTVRTPRTRCSRSVGEHLADPLNLDRRTTPGYLRLG